LTLNIAIIGCGIIGRKRANVIKNYSDQKIIAVADIDFNKAKAMGEEFECSYFNDWKKILEINEIDAVIVSTSNNNLAKISLEFAKKKKHIFCEKPLGTNVNEVENAVNAAIISKVIFKTGFTLRFHPGIQKIRSLVDENKIGKITFIRCRYGITGRPGYEKEWRANKSISGGGELIDQGVHVLDLLRWFMGDFSSVKGNIGTLYWDASVEDNAFGILKSTNDQMASFHVSWSEWDNLFSFEIFGTEGYLRMEGLGGVYGKECVTFGLKAPPDKWPPEEKIFTFEHPEICWSLEWENFVNSIQNNSEILGSGKDGLEVLKLAFKIYGESKI
jgi:predicted dehydrogenase